MDGTGDDHVKQSKPDSERQKKAYFFSYKESKFKKK
jgi:hypothetical protein